MTVSGRIVARTLPTEAEAIRVRDQLRAKAVSLALGIEAPPTPDFQSLGAIFETYVSALRTARNLGTLPPPVPLSLGKVGAELGVRFPTAEDGLTIGAVFDRYLTEMSRMERSEKSIRQVRTFRKLWSACFGEVHSARLTRDDFARYHEWAKAETKTKGSAVRAAFGAMSVAMRRVGLSVPPWPTVEVPDRRDKTVPAEQAVRFLDALGGTPRTYAEIVIRTGCRESEARRLQRQHVDLDAGMIWLPRMKGKPGARRRLVPHPIPAGLLPFLKEEAENFPPDLSADAPFLAVERNARNASGRRPLGENTFRAAFTEASKVAGITPHRTGVGWLRNEAATLARMRSADRDGLDLPTVSRGLGHDRLSTTATHYDESEAARVELSREVEAKLAQCSGRG